MKVNIFSGRLMTIFVEAAHLCYSFSCRFRIYVSYELGILIGLEKDGSASNGPT